MRKPIKTKRRRGAVAPANVPELDWNRETGLITLANGRVELVVETKPGSNARSLRDRESGQVYADSDYIWPGAALPALEQAPRLTKGPDGSCTVALQGRFGPLVVEQIFTAPVGEPGAILEEIVIRNGSDKAVVTADFKCGFAKRIREGDAWLPDAGDIRFCPVPYRRETNGKMQEFALREVAEHGVTYGGWRETPQTTPVWGAEGWVWSKGPVSLLLAKYNSSSMEWSLMEPVQRGTTTVLRFGGAGQWKYGHPEAASRLEPGQSYRFGPTLIQAVAGDWQAAFYAYRRWLESKGCGVPKDYNPPVHWNELYDNEYFFKCCKLADNYLGQGKPGYTPELYGKFRGLLNQYYTLDLMKAEAAKAQELGCEALYLDPGWDTGGERGGLHVWDTARLGPMESFVAMVKRDYGLKGVSLWCSLAGVPPTFVDAQTYPAAQVLSRGGVKEPYLLCHPSTTFLEEKEKLLLELCRNGALFLMFDSNQYSGPCFDTTHGHGIPSTREDHARATYELARRIKAKYPSVLIEMHDPITGPCGIHYTPTYYGYAPPASFDCLWGHEFMWNPLEDLLSRKAVSLYYYNIAYSIPLYLHVNLKGDNANALVFWWYASTCRHLGVGGKSSPPVWKAQKQAMKTYLEHKRFYTQGEFYGLDETIHAHTLADLQESVINVFNLTGNAMQKTIRFRLHEIGLGSPAVGQSQDTELSMDVNLPANGHQLLHVSAKPGEAPRIATGVATVAQAPAHPGEGVQFLDSPGAPAAKANLAYVGNGAKPATASSVIPNFAQHEPKGLNDGKYGNASGWICAPEDADPWFQIDLGKEARVGCVALGRDRNGQFSDRPLTRLVIALSKDGKDWQTAYSTDNLSGMEGYSPAKTAVIAFKEAVCRYVKVSVNNGACIDECEVFATAPKATTMPVQDEVPEIPPPTAEQLFRKTGTDKPEDFTSVQRPHPFDVVNSGSNHLMVAFQRSESYSAAPAVVLLAPGKRQTVAVTGQGSTNTFSLVYSVCQSPEPFVTHTNRYRAYNDGETVLCVPVPNSTFTALRKRTESILRDSKALVTDKATPPETYIYTPGPFYRHGGIFARDFLYQLEGAGRWTATAEEVKRGVDFLALKQLPETRKVGKFTYPKGAIPDHVYPDGQWSWGPGKFYGDSNGHFNRPSMDESMCFITLAWHYGFKAGWDTAWQSWFKEKAARFADAWNSVPRNPKTGLVTQWTTPGHTAPEGITETHGAAVMWGFHDSYGFGGDDLGTSVLACNAARALADMHQHAGDTAKTREWETIAHAMRDAIRAQFNPAGFLPWGIGPMAPTNPSADITGYAVWSGILTDEQADAASDWFAARYVADKAAGGAADLFHMSAPFRGTVRMARKTDDVSPGRHVWPDMRDGKHWENLAYGYNAYQDGGYWYYMSLGVAATLNRKHPELAREWVGNAYADLAAADANPPYERIDGMKPVNNRYNASVGPLMGMGRPATVGSVTVVIRKGE